MRWLRYFLVILSLVVLQTALFPHLRVFGAVPDLLLVATAAVGYERGAEGGAVFGFVSGLAIDCFLASPLGVDAGAVTGFSAGGVCKSSNSRLLDCAPNSPLGAVGSEDQNG